MEETSLKFCLNCRKNVEPGYYVNVPWAIVITILGGIVFGLIAVIIYYLYKGKKCPHCNGKRWAKPTKNKPL